MINTHDMPTSIGRSDVPSELRDSKALYTPKQVKEMLQQEEKQKLDLLSNNY